MKDNCEMWETGVIEFNLLTNQLQWSLGLSVRNSWMSVKNTGAMEFVLYINGWYVPEMFGTLFSCVLWWPCIGHVFQYTGRVVGSFWTLAKITIPSIIKNIERKSYTKVGKYMNKIKKKLCQLIFFGAEMFKFNRIMTWNYLSSFMKSLGWTSMWTWNVNLSLWHGGVSNIGIVSPGDAQQGQQIGFQWSCWTSVVQVQTPELLHMSPRFKEPADCWNLPGAFIRD